MKDGKKKKVSYNIKDQWYKYIIQNATEGFFITDMQSNILDVNDAFCNMSGYSREELLTMGLYDLDARILNLPDGKKQIEKELQFLKFIDPEPNHFTEVQHRRKDGRVVDISVSMQYIDIMGGIIFHFNRDITESKRIDNEIRMYQTQLEWLVKERTSKLELEIEQRKQTEIELKKLYQSEHELGQQIQQQMEQRLWYSRALAHELKTPLTPLLATIDLMVSANLKEPIASYARNIESGAKDLNQKINDLLDIAKSEVESLTLNYSKVDLNAMFKDIIEYEMPLVKADGLSLTVDIPCTLPVICADEQRIRQVILNLLDNAVKYTPRGGKITVSSVEEDGFIITIISDTGHGISSEDRKNLFQPYVRLYKKKDNKSGLGLGLSLSKMLVELHGGKIWLEEKDGPSSTFKFSIPVKKKRKSCTHENTDN
jgi:PAS domain S-box-containing protein